MACRSEPVHRFRNAAADSLSPQQCLDARRNLGAGGPSTPPRPIIGANPAIIQVGASYTDLSATITGPQADLTLGIQIYLNGVLESPIELDTSAAATDTIAYVVTDSQGLTSTSTRIIIVEPAAAPQTPPLAATSSSATSTSQ